MGGYLKLKEIPAQCEGEGMTDTGALSRVKHRAAQVVDGMGLWPAIASVIIMVTLIFGSIVTRFFGLPLAWVEEIIGYMVAILVLVGGSWVVQQNRHISVTVIPEKLRPRIRTGLEIITLLISFVVIGFFLWLETTLVIDNFIEGRTAWTILQTPLAPVQLLMPIGLSLFVIQIVRRIVNRVKALYARQ